MVYRDFNLPHGNLSFGWVSIAAQRSGSKYPAVVIALSMDITEHLGVVAGELVAIQVGTDEDAGWVRLRKSKQNGGAPLHLSGGKSLRVRIGGTAFCVHDLHPAVRRDPHEVFVDQDEDGPYVSFELPPWARPSEHIIRATALRNSSH